MKFLHVALLLALLAPLTALAADPPPVDPFNVADVMNPQSPVFGGSRNMVPSELSLWQDVRKFMQVSSPNQLKYFDSLPMPSNRPVRLNMRTRFIKAWSDLQAVLADKEIYTIRVNRIKIEDDLWGLAVKLRDATSPADKETLTKQMRVCSAQLFDNRIGERKVRIGRLEELLKTQNDNLAQDLSRKDQIIDDRIRQIIQNAKKLLPTSESAPADAPPAPAR